MYIHIYMYTLKYTSYEHMFYIHMFLYVYINAVIKQALSNYNPLLTYITVCIVYYLMTVIHVS